MDKHRESTEDVIFERRPSFLVSRKRLILNKKYYPVEDISWVVKSRNPPDRRPRIIITLAVVLSSGYLLWISPLWWASPMSLVLGLLMVRWVQRAEETWTIRLTDRTGRVHSWTTEDPALAEAFTSAAKVALGQ